MDRDQGTGDNPTPAAPERCSRCGGSVRLWLLLNSPLSEDEPLRVYKCDICGNFEWAPTPGQQT